MPAPPFAGAFMSTSTFRTRMLQAGRPLRSDQDVCHIVASANGGADHSDNYFIASSGFNRATGSRNDALIAFIAGREATERAVAASRATGYTGPPAEALCAQGRKINLELMVAKR